MSPRLRIVASAACCYLMITTDSDSYGILCYQLCPTYTHPQKPEKQNLEPQNPEPQTLNPKTPKP